MLNKPEPIVKADMIFSVSDASALLKTVVETAFPLIKIRGELSQITRATSGHTYMTIKDSGAAISVIIWRGTPISFKLEEGLEVIISGKFTTYPARSNYQIIASEIEMAGAGAILKMLEARKQKLAALGFFDAAQKKPLPRFPQTIGIITSPTGAAFHDIQNRLRERFPVRVLLYPATVQGATAAAEVAAGIEYFNSLPLRRDASSPPLEGSGAAGGWFSQARNSQKYYNLPFNENLTERAKELRKAGSLPEVLFWNEIKNKKLNGLDFDRQKIIGNYIVDFFCATLGLVVEIDDKASHDNKGEYDENRDKYLESLDLKVIHITAQEVLKNPTDVALGLGVQIQTCLNHPGPAGHPSNGGGLTRPDVIIVARGGGSLEDLLPFSEEVVVRAAAASKIPLVSGVGHEPDWMLIDFAADVRAATPTMAAEIVVPTKLSLISEIENMAHRMLASFTGRLANAKNRIESIVIKSPKQLIMERVQRLDDISRTMTILINNKLSRMTQSVSHIGQMLNSLSYKNVLMRGFAIVRHDNKIVGRAADFAAPAEIEFADGVVKI